MITDGYDYISEEEFDDIWGAHAKPDGNLYVYDDIRSLPIQHVWSVSPGDAIDEDGFDIDDSWYAAPGIHFINVLGYVITEKAWEVGTPDAIWSLDDDEDAREERRADFLEEGRREA